MSMTSLDILLSLLRVSIVSGVALLIGRVALSRRPDSVATVAVTALLCGCTLLALTGAKWPAVWQSTLPSDPAPMAFAEPNPTDRVSGSSTHGQPADVTERGDIAIPEIIESGAPGSGHDRN